MDFEDSPKKPRSAPSAQVARCHAKPRTKREASDPLDECIPIPPRWPKRRPGRKTKADKGYCAHHLAKGMGGIAGTPMQSIIFGQEESKYDHAAGSAFAIAWACASRPSWPIAATRPRRAM